MVEEDPEFEDAVDAMAQLFIDGAEAQHRSQLEPFDVYSQKVRNEFHKTLSDFRNRFAHGYEVLMKRIQEQGSDAQMKKSDLGPWMKA